MDSNDLSVSALEALNEKWQEHIEGLTKCQRLFKKVLSEKKKKQKMSERKIQTLLKKEEKKQQKQDEKMARLGIVVSYMAQTTPSR